MDRSERKGDVAEQVLHASQCARFHMLARVVHPVCYRISLFHEDNIQSLAFCQ